MAKYTRTFVSNNEEMTVTTDSYREMTELIVVLGEKGWTPEKNNWSGLVMATPTQEKPVRVDPKSCPHHPGRMRPDKDGKGGMYCGAKLDDDKWCGFSLKPDGTIKRVSRLDQPVQSVLNSSEDIDF